MRIKLSTGTIITHQEVIDGLRAAVRMATEFYRLTTPGFVRWPDMDALVDHLDKHGLPSPWTPIDMQLPDDEISVLIANKDWPGDPVGEGYHDGDHWCDMDGVHFEGEGSHPFAPPTHWKHLPEPPELVSSVTEVPSVASGPLPWECKENPFRVSGGIIGTSEDQVRAVRKFTLGQCRIASRLNGLGKVTSKAVLVRIRKLQKEPTK